MSFRFSLAPLLRYRQVIEYQRELALAVAIQRVNSLQIQISEVLRQKSAIAEDSLREMGEGLAASQLHFDIERRLSLNLQLARLQKDLSAASEIRSLAQREFHRANRERESLDAVRQTQLEVYQQHQVRKQQAQADDLFLLRRRSRG
jgi:flagellar export protein FliJ